jgi:hypothetical protein
MKDPKARQDDMFWNGTVRDLRALAGAASRKGEVWSPPRGLGAAAKRLSKRGLLAKVADGYLATVDGVNAVLMAGVLLDRPQEAHRRP